MSNAKDTYISDFVVFKFMIKTVSVENEDVIIFGRKINNIKVADNMMSLDDSKDILLMIS